jgi:hypothetical protein
MGRQLSWDIFRKIADPLTAETFSIIPKPFILVKPKRGKIITIKVFNN